MRAIQLLFASVLSLSVARAQFYIETSGGISRVNFESTRNDESGWRADVAVGWHVAPAFKVEASGFMTKFAGARQVGTDYSMIALPTIGVVLPSVPTVTVVSPATSPYKQWLNQQVFGTALSGVLTREIAPGVSWFGRAGLVRTSVYEASRRFDYFGRYFDAGRKGLHGWGVEAGAGLTWQVPRSPGWHASAQIRYTATENVELRSVLASLGYEFSPRPETTISPLYLAGAAGASQVDWRNGDGRSLVSHRDLRLGWQFAPWLAIEGTWFKLGSASNQRVFTYRFSAPFPVLPSIPVAVVRPDGTIELTFPPVAVPPPILITHTRLLPWTLRRQVDGFAVGPVFSLELPHGLRVFTRQQIARHSARAWGDYLTDDAGTRVDLIVQRDWRYQPGLGLEWHPAGWPRCQLGAELSYVSTSSARVSSVTTSARIRL